MSKFQWKKIDSKTIDLLSGLFCNKRRILDGKNNETNHSNEDRWEITHMNPDNNKTKEFPGK